MRRARLVQLPLLFVLVAGAYGSSFLQFDAQPITELAERKEAVSSTAVTRRTSNTMSDLDLVETMARPLFNPSRRPFVVRVDIADAKTTDPVEEKRPAETPRRIRLLGVNIVDGRFSVLVENVESREVRWVGKGEIFDGWKLLAADAQSARFGCDRQEVSPCNYKVELYADRQGQ